MNRSIIVLTGILVFSGFLAAQTATPQAPSTATTQKTTATTRKKTSTTAKPTTTTAATAKTTATATTKPGTAKTTAAKTGATTTMMHKTTPTAKPAEAWITTGSGLKYQDVVVGKGPQPQPGDAIEVNYTGKFLDGKVFDSSLNPGRTPFELHLGRGEVIPGWDEGLASMHVGGKRKLLIPPSLAYGAAGAGGVIPPNATLTFDVELLKIK